MWCWREKRMNGHSCVGPLRHNKCWEPINACHRFTHHPADVFIHMANWFIFGVGTLFSSIPSLVCLRILYQKMDVNESQANWTNFLLSGRTVILSTLKMRKNHNKLFNLHDSLSFVATCSLSIAQIRVLMPDPFSKGLQIAKDSLSWTTLLDLKQL